MLENVEGIRPERIEHPLYEIGERVAVIDRFTQNHQSFLWTGKVRDLVS